VLVIRRIRVTYHLEAPESARQKVERVHAMHHDHCPVYRTIRDSVDITTRLVLEEPGG